MEVEATKEKLCESFDKAVEYLELADYQVMLAYYEVHKYMHPVAGEIAGLMTNIINKMERLKQLKKFTMEVNEE